MSDAAGSGGGLALSERGSMIAPVAPEQLAALGELPGSLALGRTSFLRKAELHFTILNYAIGKLITKACQARADLRDTIDAAAAAHPWALVPSDTFYHLVQDIPGKPVLQTIVVLIDAPIAAFYGKLYDRVENDPDAVMIALRDALVTPPPPHVTLYTTDPAGTAGIGLNTLAELQGAIERSVAPAATPGLRAYRLHSDVVRGTTPAA